MGFMMGITGVLLFLIFILSFPATPKKSIRIPPCAYLGVGMGSASKTVSMFMNSKMGRSIRMI